VEPSDGAPADAVTGLGLGSIEFPGQAMLTSYGFTWQWTIQGQASPGPAPSASGAGPDSARAMPAVEQRLTIGQRIWYAFRYAGDNSPIVIEMSVNPPTAASFALWTPLNVKLWSEGGKENPVGHGTPNEGAGGALVWVGNFNEAGIYYVVVDQTGPYTGSFTLTASGTAVTPAGGS
jgi:hypothetical protein